MLASGCAKRAKERGRVQHGKHDEGGRGGRRGRGGRWRREQRRRTIRSRQSTVLFSVSVHSQIRSASSPGRPRQAPASVPFRPCRRLIRPITVRARPASPAHPSAVRRDPRRSTLSLARQDASAATSPPSAATIFRVIEHSVALLNVDPQLRMRSPMQGVFRVWLHN
ncbi:hypothetical protein OH77DRAFT_950607 [Trametes cingulata]|nr:hypothetical protein OH77DRAFT_950607 [Trametes cingulata]